LARCRFTSLGFYPVAPGSNQYVIGRPFVDRAVLNLAGGKRFVVRADNLGPANKYVTGITLNGRALDRSYITDAEVRAGGELHFTMGPQPDKRWATTRSARPFSISR
jgi:putative alpha-1,2-mannosidase